MENDVLGSLDYFLYSLCFTTDVTKAMVCRMLHIKDPLLICISSVLSRSSTQKYCNITQLDCIMHIINMYIYFYFTFLCSLFINTAPAEEEKVLYQVVDEENQQVHHGMVGREKTQHMTELENWEAAKVIISASCY